MLTGLPPGWNLRRLTGVLLIGQSVGCQLAAHMAARAPQRVRAVLLQGPLFDPAYRTVPRGLGRWALDLPREHPTLAVREVPEWLTVGPRRVARVLRQSQRDRLEDTVAVLDIPVRVLVGEHDPLSQLPWQHSLSRPDRPPVVMAGLPHSAPHAAPARSPGWWRLALNAGMPDMRQRLVKLQRRLPGLDHCPDVLPVVGNLIHTTGADRVQQR